MTTTAALHPLAEDYLGALDHAARRLPRRERRELVEEIKAHLIEAIDRGMSDAEVLTVLDRLGDPEDIVEAQRPDEPAGADRRGMHEWAAIFLLLLGGLVFGVGWIVGLILLWSSRAWTTRDKLIGTFVVPGGLAGTLLLLGIAGISSSQVCSGSAGRATHCTGGPSTLGQIVAIVLAIIFVIGPIFTSVYLARRAR